VCINSGSVLLLFPLPLTTIYLNIEDSVFDQVDHQPKVNFDKKRPEWARNNESTGTGEHSFGCISYFQPLFFVVFVGLFQ
jgi:hypothetical protein